MHVCTSAVPQRTWQTAWPAENDAVRLGHGVALTSLQRRAGGGGGGRRNKVKWTNLLSKVFFCRKNLQKACDEAGMF